MQKRDLNPYYFLNALQSLAIMEQLEIEENCTENICPAYAEEGLKHKNVPVARKKSLP